MIAEVANKKVAILERPQKSYWEADKLYTFDEYFKLEEKAPFKSEFRNGKVVKMPNGTTEHGKIIGSLFFYLKTALKSIANQTLVCTSEIKVFVKAIGEGLYPDVYIVVGTVDHYKKNKAITNPTIIFEVLSSSTGNYDRPEVSGEKFRKYKQLPSFTEYVLIEQDQPVIDVLYKKAEGTWEMKSYIGLKDVLVLNTVPIKIPLSDIYEDVAELYLPQKKADLE